MYLNFWDLNRSPFAQQFDLTSCYESEGYTACRLKLDYLLEERKNFAILTGDIGTGKSFLLHQFQQQKKQTHKLIQVKIPPYSTQGLLEGLARELEFPLMEFRGYTADQQLQVLIQRIEEWTNDLTPICMVFDDAHFLDQREVFVCLHLLLRQISALNSKFQIIMAGHGCLREQLSLVPELEDRIDVVANLPRYNINEIAEYVETKLSSAGCKETIFPRETIEFIEQASGGTARRINKLCDLGMLIAYAEESKIVYPDMLQEVAQEVYYRNVA